MLSLKGSPLTMAWVYQSRQMTCPRPGRKPVRGMNKFGAHVHSGLDSPETEVTFGVSTGVTKMSRPTMNWRSTESNSGSCGNSKKRARTGGVPYKEAFAKRVY